MYKYENHTKKTITALEQPLPSLFSRMDFDWWQHIGMSMVGGWLFFFYICGEDCRGRWREGVPKMNKKKKNSNEGD